MTKRHTVITVQSDDPADSAVVTAALNLFFRVRGVLPKITSERPAELLTLGADEWTVNNNLHNLFSPPEGTPPTGATVELVDQPPIVATCVARPNPIE